MASVSPIFTAPGYYQPGVTDEQGTPLKPQAPDPPMATYNPASYTGNTGINGGAKPFQPPDYGPSAPSQSPGMQTGERFEDWVTRNHRAGYGDTAPAFDYWRQVIRDIQVVSPTEALYQLKRPDGNFLITLSEMTGGIERFSKAQLEKKGPATMQSGPIAGTGPYQYKERTQSQFIRFERTPFKHWRATPDFQEFEFRFAKEASTRLAGLLAGEVHMASLPQDLLKNAEGRGMKVAKGKVAGPRIVTIPFSGGGGEATIAVLGGRVEAMVNSGAGNLGHVKAGTMRALAVFTKGRYEPFPDATPVGDIGYNATIGSAFYVIGPKGMPHLVAMWYGLVGGKIYDLDAHLDRFLRSAERSKLALPGTR